ncbi:8ac9bc67-88eb-4467-aafd-c59d3e688eec [Thermothielavioides terrestris]|uniref:8ac9bc67-88eb-4467-aafd-c59d3e688eec n=1 Tax=Thermothielavioides terrestris TaxID=2587410 RepID=A0A446B9E4_9PEZI|nr:8ac9bc67-88eb-4467-aafd-c59d3e688eec [Thermothielavioides terrestris]
MATQSSYIYLSLPSFQERRQDAFSQTPTTTTTPTAITTATATNLITPGTGNNPSPTFPTTTTTSSSRTTTANVVATAAFPTSIPAGPAPAPASAKYGPCPKCRTGRRVRSRFNPHGTSPHRGKFRFVCSNRGGGGLGLGGGLGGGGGGCDYWEVLERDPLQDPGAYRPGLGPARGLGQGQGRAVDMDMDMDVDMEMEGEMWEGGAAGFDGHGRGLGLGLGQGLGLGREHGLGQGQGRAAAAAGRDKTPHQRLGCPECMMGQLVQKCKDTFRWRERVLVCEKVWNGQEWTGGCGYRLEIENGPNDDGVEEKEDGGGQVLGGVAAYRGPCGKGMQQEQKAKRKEDEDKWLAEKMEKVRNNPLAAAVIAEPEGSCKKVVVDLTEDEELVGASSQTLPATPMEVGGKETIYIEDDSPVENHPRVEDSPVDAGFDELGSEDEMELIKVADRVGNAADRASDSRDDDLDEEVKFDDLDEEAELDDLDEEDELELMKLADRAAASLPPQ